MKMIYIARASDDTLEFFLVPPEKIWCLHEAYEIECCEVDVDIIGDTPVISRAFVTAQMVKEVKAGREWLVRDTIRKLEEFDEEIATLLALEDRSDKI